MHTWSIPIVPWQPCWGVQEPIHTHRGGSARCTHKGTRMHRCPRLPWLHSGATVKRNQPLMGFVQQHRRGTSPGTTCFLVLLPSNPVWLDTTQEHATWQDVPEQQLLNSVCLHVPDEACSLVVTLLHATAGACQQWLSTVHMQRAQPMVAHVRLLESKVVHMSQASLGWLTCALLPTWWRI